MRSEEIRQDMYHEARMCAEYAALGLWDEASRRAKSYKRLENQLRAADPDWAAGTTPDAGRPPEEPAKRA